MARPENSAHSVRVEFCETCQYPHLVLYDIHGHAFAQAVISQSIVDTLQRALIHAHLEGSELQ